MTYLVAGLVIFFGTHLFTSFRPRLAGADMRVRMGEMPYMATYSVIALIGLVLIVYGVGAAREGMQADQLLYVPPRWAQHVNYALMPIALIALVSAYAPTGYIKKTLKHPMLVAIKVWAFGHLLANGELYSVVLFGSFLAYAVIDRIAVKRRGDLGPPADLRPNPMGDVIAIIVGLAAFFAILFWLHGALFGASVWPVV